MSRTPGYRRRPADLLDLTGHDRESFLQGQCTNDVARLPPGGVLRAAILTPKGKLAAIFRCGRKDDRYRLLGEGSLASELVPQLRRHLVFTQAAVEIPPDLERFDFYASTPARLSPTPPGRLGDARLAGVPAELWPAEFEWTATAIVARAHADEIARELDRELRVVPADEADIARIEAGRAAWNVDVDGSRLPDEAGLDDAISTTKGCYVGQEIVARRKTYGRLHRRLVRWSFPNGIIPAGASLVSPRNPDEELGSVTSAAESPGLGAIGLGWAKTSVAEGEALAFRDDPSRTALLEPKLTA